MLINVNDLKIKKKTHAHTGSYSCLLGNRQNKTTNSTSYEKRKQKNDF